MLGNNWDGKKTFGIFYETMQGIQCQKPHLLHDGEERAGLAGGADGKALLVGDDGAVGVAEAEVSGAENKVAIGMIGLQLQAFSASASKK